MPPGAACPTVPGCGCSQIASLSMALRRCRSKAPATPVLHHSASRPVYPAGARCSRPGARSAEHFTPQQVCSSCCLEPPPPGPVVCVRWSVLDVTIHLGLRPRPAVGTWPCLPDT